MPSPLRSPRLLLCAIALLALPSSGAAARSPSPSPSDEKMTMNDAKKMGVLLFAPFPSYPYEARRDRAIGAGIAILAIDQETGLVKEAHMQLSTGSPILDQNTLDTLRRWRFRPHTLYGLKVPIHYDMPSIGVDYRKKQKPMAEILAPYLGPGAVRKAPIPQYPGRQNWGFKHGKGIYEIRSDAAGKVTAVKVLTSSGDAVFDEAVQKTLRKWQFNRGPLTVELPLAFALTPTSYRVDVAR